MRDTLVHVIFISKRDILLHKNKPPISSQSRDTTHLLCLKYYRKNSKTTSVEFHSISLMSRAIIKFVWNWILNLLIWIQIFSTDDKSRIFSKNFSCLLVKELHPADDTRGTILSISYKNIMKRSFCVRT